MKCEDYLDKCQAACCRVFYLQFKKLPKGKKIKLKLPLEQDRIKYYQIHGCEYIHGFLIVTKKKFDIVSEEDNFWAFHRDCDWLENLHCKYNDIKPQVCKDFDPNTGKGKNSKIAKGCFAYDASNS